MCKNRMTDTHKNQFDNEVIVKSWLQSMIFYNKEENKTVLHKNSQAPRRPHTLINSIQVTYLHF